MLYNHLTKFHFDTTKDQDHGDYGCARMSMKTSQILKYVNLSKQKPTNLEIN